MLHRAVSDTVEGDLGPQAWRHVDAVLDALLSVTTSRFDDGFHARLARGLAEAVGCHTAFVGELIVQDGAAHVATQAVWSRGEAAPDFSYPLVGTPCEEVIGVGMLQVERDVCARFPDDHWLGQVGAESYLGVVLRGSDGEPVGHLAVLDDRPFRDDTGSRTILQIFAARASIELDRRWVGSRLRSVEDHFRLLFEQSPNAIIVFDPESLKPVEFNDQAAEMMGYTRHEFAELTISDLEQVPNPEETRRHIEAILDSGGDVFEALHKAKDGSPRHVVVSLRVTEWKGRRRMLTLWHDITARKAAERALETSRRHLQSIFDSAMDAVVILDDELKLSRVNPAAEKIFRCKAADVLGRPVRAFFPGDEAARLFAQLPATASRHGPESIWAPEGLMARRDDGAVFPVELTLSPFEIDGVAAYTLILRDVNDRRRAEKELRRLREEKRLLQEQLSENTVIVGDSPAMAGVLSHVTKVAGTDSTVLILGETGTGKELIARAIHEQSVRRDRVMVTINCAALPKDLLESELFGHEKGAFTGATQRKRGRFEQAAGGTLFLDEVGELSAEAQAKLLRALQEGEIQRLGGETTIRVNVRAVAATNRDLAVMVQEGSFRSDLYYRLSVFPLRVPPLRERRTDILPLVEHFIGTSARRFGKTLTHFDAPSMERLLSYGWPGNIRELQNIVERSAILSNGPELTLEEGLLHGLVVGVEDGKDGLEEVTRRHVLRVLQECDWVVEGRSGAAVRLGLKPGTLRFRMKKLGIERPG